MAILMQKSNFVPPLENSTTRTAITYVHTRLGFIDTDILHAALFMWKNEHRVHKRKSSKKCSRRETLELGETLRGWWGEQAKTD